MSFTPKAFLLLTLFFTTLLLQAETYRFETLHSMPKSVEKDYYIWRFLLQENTSSKEAKEIMKEVSHLNKKLRLAYLEKTGHHITPPSTKQRTKAPKKRQEVNYSKRAKGNRAFQKGIAFVESQQLQKAADAFYEAYGYYTQRWEKDKTLFWLYLVTEDKTYLKRLHQSYHINLYTLLSADILQTKYPKSIVTPKISKKRIHSLNSQNPIHWAKIKAKIANPSTNLSQLAQACKSQESVGIYCYIQAKAQHYTKSYFPLPYRKTMRQFPKKRQALIYAIARQESRFIPASVSRSFALGMMQFMPFLIEHIAKERGEKIELEDIFNPQKAIIYANAHLDYLEKYLYHPLFIAYAYNGGIGFTKRLLQDPHFFHKGAFEPYLSMEKMRNVQAREYGKRVLTNYVIYLNKLGIPSRILPYIQQLTNPQKTDRFRDSSQ